MKLENIQSVGNYALKLEFDDGHDTGIFSWNYLETLGRDQKVLWNEYLLKLDAAGKSRDLSPPDTQVIKIKPLKK